MTNAHKHEADDYLERQQLRQSERRFTADQPPTTPLTLKVRRLNANAKLPTRAHATDSGFDLYAAEDVLLAPGETAIVPTGIALELPPGYDAQIRPRSGVTAKTKLRVQLGTIDESYRKELGIIVDNTYRSGRNPRPFIYDVEGKPSKISQAQIDEGTYAIKRGDRLAQLVVSKRADIALTEVDADLDETGRGGFGSTGVR